VAKALGGEHAGGGEAKPVSAGEHHNALQSMRSGQP
jgi:hypothetical protein